VKWSEVELGSSAVRGTKKRKLEQKHDVPVKGFREAKHNTAAAAAAGSVFSFGLEPSVALCQRLWVGRVEHEISAGEQIRPQLLKHC